LPWPDVSFDNSASPALICLRCQQSDAHSFTVIAPIESVMKYCPQCQRQYPDVQRFCLSDGAILSLPDPYNLVGNTLADKYRIDALIGIGGMGAVYSAHHLSLDRRVAFKILLPHLALQSPAAVGLFESEAKTAARLRHDNIVQIFDAGRVNNIAYIAMEWLDGRGLDEALREEGRLSFERAAQILCQIVAALEEAHEHRTIHRDLKPSNVMLIRRRDGREQVKVLDFGIGKVLSSTDGSLVSRVMGTPAYSSPEQLTEGAVIDARSDIYSLGIMLFEFLTGQLPFNATKLTEMISLQLTASPPLLRNLRPDAPAAMEELLNRMLAKKPEARPQHISDVLAQFDLARQAPNQVKPQPLPEPVRQDEEPRPATDNEPETLPRKQPDAVPKPKITPVAEEEVTPSLVPKKTETSRLPQPQPGSSKSGLAIGGGLAAIVLIITVVAVNLNKPDPASSPVATPLLPAGSSPALQRFEFNVVRTDADGEVTARSKARAGYFTEALGNGMTLEMVEVPGGTFTMGSPSNEAERENDEGPQHQVTVSSFAMGKYEVTQQQWRAVMNSNPSKFKGDRLPVESVSWNDAKEFCARLKQRTGKAYRLPSEAEWEYACRAGTTTPFAFGETITPQIVNYHGNYPYGNASEGAYREKPTPVGSFGVANAFGLSDLHGNVWEWCEDVWHPDYNGAPDDGRAWTTGGDQNYRLLRGGSWLTHGWSCRSAGRLNVGPGDRLYNFSFRVVVSARTP
jgi:formylglycine-generating enzyme required for sulfatase activity